MRRRYIFVQKKKGLSIKKVVAVFLALMLVFGIFPTSVGLTALDMPVISDGVFLGSEDEGREDALVGLMPGGDDLNEGEEGEEIGAESFASGEGLTYESGASGTFPTGFYANGRELVFKAGSATGYTNVYYAGETEPIDLAQLYPGITGSKAEGYDLNTGYTFFFLGSCGADYTGNTRAIIEGGKLSYIFGGGMSGTTMASANVTGDTHITVKGGTISRIHGGGRGAGAGAEANVYGNTHIVVENVDSVSMIVGGGYVNTGDGFANISGSTNITIDGGTLTTIYGGGYAGGTASTTVADSTNITVNGGSVTNLYGGGYAYAANTTAAVETSRITINSFAPSAGTVYIYGGGYVYGPTISESTSAKVMNANVTIGSGVSLTGITLNVYGGGYAYSGANANADVVNATITYAGEQRSANNSLSGTIYGGGRASASYSAKVENSALYISGAVSTVDCGGGAGGAVTGSSTIYVTGGSFFGGYFKEGSYNSATTKLLYVSGGNFGTSTVTSTGSGPLNYTRLVSPDDSRPVYLTKLTLSNNGAPLPILTAVTFLDIEDADGQVYAYGTEKMYVGYSAGNLLLMLPEGAKVKGATIGGVYYQATTDIVVTPDHAAAGMLFFGNVTPVTSISGVPTSGVANPTLAVGSSTTSGTQRVQLGGNGSITIKPADATFKSITWSVKRFSGSEGSAWIAAGYLYANWAGIATVTATIKNGISTTEDYTQDFEVDFTFPSITPVTGITEPISETEVNEETVLTSVVTPTSATNKNIIWSVKDDGDTGAVISGAVMTAASPGIVTLTATVKNGTAWGTDYAQDFTVLVTPEKVTITDPNTGISIKGVVDAPTAQLVVIEKEKNEVPPDLESAIPTTHTFITAYEVKLDGGEFGKGTSAITLPVSSEYNGRTVTITHDSDDSAQKALETHTIATRLFRGGASGISTYSALVIDGTVTVAVPVGVATNLLGVFAVSTKNLTVKSITGTQSISIEAYIEDDNESYIFKLAIEDMKPHKLNTYPSGIQLARDDKDVIITGDIINGERQTLQLVGTYSDATFFNINANANLTFKDINIVIDCNYKSFLNLNTKGTVMFENCVVTSTSNAAFGKNLISAIGNAQIILIDTKFSGFPDSHIIYADGSSVAIKNCTFSNGGKSALYLVSGSANISDSSFENFDAKNDANPSNPDFRYGGGAVFALNMTALTIENSSFKNCKAVQPSDDSPSYGGAIFIGGSSNTGTDKVLRNVTIENCEAAMLPVTDGGSVITGGEFVQPSKLGKLGGGGGLCVYGGQRVLMYGGSISGCKVNITNGMGGGVAALQGSSLTVYATEVSDNTAARGGGLTAFHSRSNASIYSRLEIYDADIHGNEALNDQSFDCMGGGGGVFAGLCSSLTISGSTEIYNNKARRGGGVSAESKPYNQALTDLTINSAHIHDNEAVLYSANSGLGGGVYVDSYITASIAGTVVRQNSANQNGGGVWLCSHGNVNILPVDGAAIYQNTAVHSGDDVHTEMTGSDPVPRLRDYVTISHVTLGQGYADWYQDESGNKNSAKAEESYYINRDLKASGDISLKSNMSAEDIAKAKNPAILIEGNRAESGGGVAINGDAVFGRDGAILTDVKLVKKDADTGRLLQGAMFQLYDKDGRPVGGDLMTNARGEINITGLVDGEAYYFIETKAPTGYVMANAANHQYRFTADIADSTPVIVTNTSLTVGIALTKVDADDTNKTLQGAVFQLYDKDDKKVGFERMTDKDGKIYVDGLRADEGYYFVEVSASYGYKMPVPANRFDVHTTTNKAITVTNEKENLKGPLTIKKEINSMDLAGNPHTPDTNAEFEFSVTIDVIAPGESVPYSISDGAITSSGAVSNGGIIKLKHKETAIFADIPVGTFYSVVENSTFDATTDSYISFGHVMSGRITSTAGAIADFLNIFVSAGAITTTSTSSLVVVDRILAHPEDIDYNQEFEVTITIGTDPSKSYQYEIIKADPSTEWDYYDANDPRTDLPVPGAVTASAFAYASNRGIALFNNTLPDRSANSTSYGAVTGSLQDSSATAKNNNVIFERLNHGAALIVYDIPVGTPYWIEQREHVEDGYLIDSTYRTTGFILPDKDVLPDTDGRTGDTHLLRVRADIFNYFTRPVEYVYEVKKEWVGGSNPPASTEMRLVNESTGTFDSRTMTPMSNWITSFSALKYDNAGKVIQYKLEEVPVSGYTPSYDDVTPSGNLDPNYSKWVVTNTYNRPGPGPGGGSGGGGGGASPDPGIPTMPGIVIPTAPGIVIPTMPGIDVPTPPGIGTSPGGITTSPGIGTDPGTDGEGTTAGTKKPPKTGDHSSLAVSILMLLFSAAGFCVSFVRMRNANNKRRRDAVHRPDER